MVLIMEGGRVPIKSWCVPVEEDVLSQARAVAALPVVFRQICLMPDAHAGYGMPIGGVAATVDAVIPNAVGVDIGCGMTAVRTSLREIDRDRLKDVISRIRKAIPLGFEHHKRPQSWQGFDRAPEVRVVERELEAARCQLGTLGGGNHFIEIQRGSDGCLWVMVHSGSRNFGLKIAHEYNQQAQRLQRRRFPHLPQYTGDGGLAFLPADCGEFHEYIDAMTFAVSFAQENRARMIERIKECLAEADSVEFGEAINIAHNYASCETHFGKSVWVHRKGATAAREGEIGIIPGSQGTPSYIVRGRGNRESFCSCSHGAGRRMSRHQARRSLDVRDEQAKLESQGIIHSIRGARDLDEAAGAYKDIQTVMAAQSDLVEIETELRPLGVIKG